MPERIQRKRTKGWKMPPNTVNVARPSIFGNPQKVTEFTSAERAVQYFKDWLVSSKPDAGLKKLIWERLPELRGKNLACWCPVGSPCHADVLLELANMLPPNAETNT